MNIDVSKVNVKDFDTGLQVLFKLIDKANSFGMIKTSKTDLAKELEKSRECVGVHINKLAKAGVIKYQYSGWVCLNPYIIYLGNDEEFARAVERYSTFKSNVY